MNLEELVAELESSISGTSNEKYQKKLKKSISLVREIQEKGLDKDERLTSMLMEMLSGVSSEKQLAEKLKTLKKLLMRDFGFVPPMYYTTLGLGIGVAMGASLGTSFGIPFGVPNGIVFGMMIGSGVGITGGVVVGQFLDGKKKSSNLTLQHMS
ncbi:hypothetical protein [Roseivirga sp.]|uniref:hypothetical protein n=1 Tax=Roseivirga sp. TaxID=1964215 RepID=UPI003B51ADC8